jgi:hypothetical protein
VGLDAQSLMLTSLTLQLRCDLSSFIQWPKVTGSVLVVLPREGTPAEHLESNTRGLCAQEGGLTVARPQPLPWRRKALLWGCRMGLCHTL